MKFINKKIFTIALAVTAVHFVLTLALDYYIAVQVRDQTEKIDKELSDKIFKSPRNYPRQKMKEEVKILSQKIKEKNEELGQRWKIPSFVMSLPITRFISPPLHDFLKKRFDKFLSKEISREQIRTEAILIVGAIYIANSFAFGLFIYAIIIIFNRQSRHNKPRRRAKNKPGRQPGRTVAGDKVSSVKKTRS
jgi:hypothetical protein